MNTTYYQPHPDDSDAVVGYVGYTRTVSTPWGTTREVEDLVTVRTGACCDWTPELAAAYKAR